MSRDKDNKAPRIKTSDFCGEFDAIHIGIQPDIQKIDCGGGILSECGKQLVRIIGGKRERHIIFLDTDGLSDNIYDLLLLRQIVLTYINF